jgi:hypothetical protein
MWSDDNVDIITQWKVLRIQIIRNKMGSFALAA